MKIVDVGSGVPVVLVPGIQGRWEWLKPAVDALGTRVRVITFSLADEPTGGWTFNPADGFIAYVEQIRQALDAAGVRRATICGVSYGGLIAARFAERHANRVSSLIMVSAVPPGWKPDRRVRFYLRAPALLSPLFLVASLRMYREIAAATPGFVPGVVAAVRHALNALTHMFSPGRMARRVRMLESLNLTAGLERVDVPTLVITGDAALDRVVPVAQTKEYLRIWPRATYASLPRTGHLGLITRPKAFADLVAAFLESDAAAPQRRTGSTG